MSKQKNMQPNDPVNIQYITGWGDVMDDDSNCCILVVVDIQRTYIDDTQPFLNYTVIKLIFKKVLFCRQIFIFF